LLLLLLWIPFLRFFIMNMLVCFFEKVKINILFKFLDFHQYNSFVLQSMQNPHLWACFDISTKPNFGDDYAKCKPVVSLLLKITFLTLIFSWFSQFLCLCCCCYTTCLQWRELDHFSVRFHPLWHTCSHSPLDYAQVTDNWLTFVDYLLGIYLR
jgi:hypothetical protein